MQIYQSKCFVAGTWPRRALPLLLLSMWLVTTNTTGCSRSPAPTDGDDEAVQSAGGSVDASSRPPGNASSSGQQFVASDSQTPPDLAPMTPTLPRANGPLDEAPLSTEQLPSPNSLISRLQLRSGGSPRELSAFLGDADREMGALINGRTGTTDPQAVKREVERIVTLKRTAAERLSQHPAASEADQITGHRGVLQALSHLASMGDVKAAEELQSFAEQYRESPHAALRSDSHLVLIGLAIESLRHGKADAAADVLELVHELLDANEQVDVATLMVLGQTKDALLQYDYRDQATEVRNWILERFGHARDAEVARMAAVIAASGFSQEGTAMERLDQLRQQFVSTATAGLEGSTGEGATDLPAPVSASVWRSAIDEVLAAPADVLTVEFLCGASLEAEAVGRGDIAAATYEVLQQKFADRQDAMGQIARTALRARENRRDVIGQEFQPDLPSVDGRPLTLEDYRGKVILMPFWSSAFPDSLAVLPNLYEIQSSYPERVAIVGMNLDVAGTDVEGFVRREHLEFPSFRSESDPRAEIVNEVAYRFGAVTLLFVAVLDAEGRVAHLNFSGEDLMAEVQNRIR